MPSCECVCSFLSDEMRKLSTLSWKLREIRGGNVNYISVDLVQNAFLTQLLYLLEFRSYPFISDHNCCTRSTYSCATATYHFGSFCIQGDHNYQILLKFVVSPQIDDVTLHWRNLHWKILCQKLFLLFQSSRSIRQAFF